MSLLLSEHKNYHAARRRLARVLHKIETGPTDVNFIPKTVSNFFKSDKTDKTNKSLSLEEAKTRIERSVRSGKCGYWYIMGEIDAIKKYIKDRNEQWMKIKDLWGYLDFVKHLSKILKCKLSGDAVCSAAYEILHIADVRHLLLYRKINKKFNEIATDILCNVIGTSTGIINCSLYEVFAKRAMWDERIADNWDAAIKLFAVYLQRKGEHTPERVIVREIDKETQENTMFFNKQVGVRAFGDAYRNPTLIIKRSFLSFSNSISQKTEITQVAFGHDHAIVLDTTRHVWTAGSNDEGQLGYGYLAISQPQRSEEFAQIVFQTAPGIVNVAAGYAHNIVTDYKGQVWSWGCNQCGQLGLKPRRFKDEIYSRHGLSIVTTPTSVTGCDSSFPDTRGQTKVRYPFVAAGSQHSAIANQFGLMYTFGSNNYEQLGRMDEKSSDMYKIITAYNGRPLKVANITAKGDRTAVITFDGEVHAMGFGFFPRKAVDLEHGTPYPAYVPSKNLSNITNDEVLQQVGGENALQVEISENSLAIVTIDGKVFTLGTRDENGGNCVYHEKTTVSSFVPQQLSEGVASLYVLQLQSQSLRRSFKSKEYKIFPSNMEPVFKNGFVATAISLK